MAKNYAPTRQAHPVLNLLQLGPTSTVVKILTTKVCVTGCGLDLKGTFLDGNKKNWVGTVPM